MPLRCDPNPPLGQNSRDRFGNSLPILMPKRLLLLVATLLDAVLKILEQQKILLSSVQMEERMFQISTKLELHIKTLFVSCLRNKQNQFYLFLILFFCLCVLNPSLTIQECQNEERRKREDNKKKI